MMGPLGPCPEQLMKSSGCRVFACTDLCGGDELMEDDIFDPMESLAAAARDLVPAVQDNGPNKTNGERITFLFC